MANNKEFHTGQVVVISHGKDGQQTYTDATKFLNENVATRKKSTTLRKMKASIGVVENVEEDGDIITRPVLTGEPKSRKKFWATLGAGFMIGAMATNPLATADYTKKIYQALQPSVASAYDYLNSDDGQSPKIELASADEASPLKPLKAPETKKVPTPASKPEKITSNTNNKAFFAVFDYVSNNDDAGKLAEALNNKDKKDHRADSLVSASTRNAYPELFNKTCGKGADKTTLPMSVSNLDELLSTGTFRCYGGEVGTSLKIKVTHNAPR